MSVASAPALAGPALAWFLLFPSLGLVQKYLGTTAAFAYFGVGFVLVLWLTARDWSLQSKFQAIDQRWISPAMGVLFAALVIGFVILYPLSNSHVRPWASDAAGGSGSDRDESLKLGVSELLAGRYPYYQSTQLENSVTQLPGGLLLAVPFALLGNAVWQNLFWFGAFLAFTRHLFGRDHLAVGYIALAVAGSPVVLQDFMTGGDLGVNAITIFLGMFLIVTLAPDASISSWKKAGVAVFTGIALSSRLNYLLLLPLLFAAVARRAGLTAALVCLLVIGAAFTAVTLPFYLHDPAGFAPLHLHNKFSQFEGEVRGGGILFPLLSLAFSLIVALHPRNRAVGVWLIQCGLVLAFPVVLLVGLATARLHAPNFLFTDYAIAGVFFGGIGAVLSVLRPVNASAAIALS